MAQSTTFKLKPYHAASVNDDDTVVDAANMYAEGGRRGCSVLEQVLVVLWTILAAIPISVSDSHAADMHA